VKEEREKEERDKHERHFEDFEPQRLPFKISYDFCFSFQNCHPDGSSPHSIAECLHLKTFRTTNQTTEKDRGGVSWGHMRQRQRLSPHSRYQATNDSDEYAGAIWSPLRWLFDPKSDSLLVSKAPDTQGSPHDNKEAWGLGTGLFVQENKGKMLICALTCVVVSPVLLFFALQHIYLMMLHPEQFTLIPFPDITGPLLFFLSLPLAAVLLPFFLWDIFKGTPRCAPAGSDKRVPECVPEGTPAFPGQKDKVARDYQNQPRYPIG
jgi:hypothetical protein